jgi:hypothetical protein
LNPSGIRLGTPALTTRGLDEDDIDEVADFIHRGKHLCYNSCKKKIKPIPVTGRGGPWVCETSRLPHFLDTQLTDVGGVVSHVY